MKTNRLFIILCVTIVAALLVIFIKREVSDRHLARLADEASYNTSRMIADNLQLDTVKADYPALVFYFTYFDTGASVNGDDIKASEMQWLRDNSCGDSIGYRSVLSHGFTIKRHYQDMNGIHIALVEFSAKDCRTD